MNIEERIARIRAVHSGPTQAMPSQKAVQAVRPKREVEAAPLPASEVVFDIANNSVAKIMGSSEPKLHPQKLAQNAGRAPVSRGM